MPPGRSASCARFSSVAAAAVSQRTPPRCTPGAGSVLPRSSQRCTPPRAPGLPPGSGSNGTEFGASTAQPCWRCNNVTLPLRRACLAIPLLQMYRVGRYVLTRKLRGEKRYPLVLMLEPLFQCNLACAGCGKIDYPKEVLQRRMSVADALRAVDECGAPVVSIAGGEPLIHHELPQIVAGIVARKKFVYLCTNAILLPRHIDEYRPSPYLTLSLHLDGDRDRHDESVCQPGVFDKVIAAIRLARSKGFRVTVNCTLFNNADPQGVTDFFDTAMQQGIEGITVSPGYSYSHAPRQDVFLGRTASKSLFREVFRRGRQRAAGRRWSFNHSALY